MPLSRSSRIFFSLRSAIVGLVLITPVGLFASEFDLNGQPSSNVDSGASGKQPGDKGGPPATVCEPASLGSPFVPVDSWIYAAMFRLYGSGFLDHVFLGMRPWTRSSINR